MRDIKFRAWYDRVMYSDVQDEYDSLFPSFGSILDLVQNGPQCNISAVMQYTGLKDKNGVEIYEGDVVNFVIDGEDERSEVFFDLGGFSVRARNTDPVYTPYLGEIPECYIEVIGNVWENPELMEVDSESKKSGS